MSLATPFPQSYYDNPANNMVYLAGLGHKETEVYTIGYVSAMHQILEALSDERRPYLEAALATDDEMKQAKLMIYVKLFDGLTKTIEERVRFLEESILSGPSGEDF